VAAAEPGTRTAADYPPLIQRPDIDGVKVVSDVVLESGLSKHVGYFVAITGIRVLTLEDESVVYGCAEDEFAGTLGQVRQHRRAEHGVSLGGRRKTHKSVAEAEAAGDLDAGPLVLPAETGSMTLRDFMRVAGEIDQWAVVLENLEQRLAEAIEQRDEARIEARAATRELATMKRKLARAMGLEIVNTPEEH